MTTKEYNPRKVRIGKVYLHHTFAGVDVHSRITKIENLEKGIFLGVLVRQHDVDALRAASVAYPKDIKLSECEGVVYSFQIIREIRGPRKKNVHQKSTGKRRIVRSSKR